MAFDMSLRKSMKGWRKLFPRVQYDSPKCLHSQQEIQQQQTQS